jgi:hypothetical protein
MGPLVALMPAAGLLLGSAGISIGVGATGAAEVSVVAVA